MIFAMGGLETVQSSSSVKTKIADEKVSLLEKEVRNLIKITGEQQIRIKFLEKKSKLYEKAISEERQSRKDSVIIANPPFHARGVNDTTIESLRFFKKKFGN